MAFVLNTKDSRIQSLEHELELFEWEFQRLRARPSTGTAKMSANSLNDTNNCNNSNDGLNRDKCKSISNINEIKNCESEDSDRRPVSRLSTVPKCIKTDAEKEVRLTRIKHTEHQTQRELSLGSVDRL